MPDLQHATPHHHKENGISWATALCCGSFNSLLFLFSMTLTLSLSPPCLSFSVQRSGSLQLFVCIFLLFASIDLSLSCLTSFISHFLTDNKQPQIASCRDIMIFTEEKIQRNSVQVSISSDEYTGVGVWSHRDIIKVNIFSGGEEMKINPTSHYRTWSLKPVQPWEL